MKFKEMPIQRKLMMLVLLTSGTVLLFTCSAFFAYELFTFRQSSVRHLSTLGQIISTNSTASLAFYNQDDAAEVLSALKAEPHIIGAALYDEHGVMFAKFPVDSPASYFPVKPGNSGYQFAISGMSGFQPVIQGDKRLGTLYLESDTKGMYERLRLYAVIVTLVVIGSCLLAVILSKMLQRRISKPILDLAETAKIVSDKRDYSVRAVKASDDEIGVLTDGFNQMLTEIQEHNQETSKASARLQGQLNRHTLLNRITRAIGERLDLPSIFQVITRTLEDDLPIDFGCVCLYDPALETLTVCSIGSKSQDLARDMYITINSQLPIDQNGLARAIRGYLVYEPDVSNIHFTFPQKLAKAGLHSVVIAPLLVESSVFGVLVAARKEKNAFTSPDCEFLRQLSEHAALAAHQAKIYGELQQAYDELRQSQRTVMQQERLRALGEMASGIAHDINNAISPAALYAESLLEQETGLSPEARDYLETIQRAIGDVAATMGRMREFYRHRETQMVLAPIDINQMVKHAIDLTRARWRDVPLENGVVIDSNPELASNLPEVMGSEPEIRDALTNLIFNAVDAMTSGGTLTIRTRFVSAYNHDAASGSVHVEVSDTGAGMDEETRRHCLEPFYTTKGERGTGLGLAMVYGMVQRHSAEIEIDSKPGTGTTVRLIFPVLQLTSSTEDKSIQPTRPSRLKILVVDDDPMLTKSLRDILEKDGHQITTADGGQAGIDTFQTSLNNGNGSRFDAVITDLGMPHVDGRKVSAAVKSVSPKTPVILLTGWGQRMIAEHDIPPNVDRLLAKPPKISELRKALASVMTEAARKTAT